MTRRRPFAWRAADLTAAGQMSRGNNNNDNHNKRHTHTPAEQAIRLASDLPLGQLSRSVYLWTSASHYYVSTTIVRFLMQHHSSAFVSRALEWVL